MSYLLLTHEKGYRVSFEDCLFSVGTLCSGVSYAKRHWDLSNRSSAHCLGHRAIAVLQAIPVIGLLCCLVERIVAYMARQKPLPHLIVSQKNQYQAGGMDVSICTSCAAAFLQNLKANAPLNAETIDQSLAEGRKIHEQVARAMRSPPNTNLNAQQVIQHGALGFREMKPAVSSRPTDPNALSRHYADRLVPALLDPARKIGDLTCAIFTKAPYSTALAYRHSDQKFLFFDSHGEPETDNRAFIRTFDAPSLCHYLANRYGYIDFPDVDFDQATGQDNPNSYELTFV